MMRISCVVAARPNFIKMAPLLTALDRGDCTTELVHTGQHYDDLMAGAFFEDLQLRAPDVELGVGSGSHAEQTAGVLVGFERHLIDTSADIVVVVGDVNATLGAALAAAKLGVPVAHVEAGLRSGDWSMPEEINRVLTDRLSRWLFTPSPDADAHLIAEGILSDRIHRVGNIMIDTLLEFLPQARQRFEQLARLLALPPDYAVVTLHRPSNVDNESDLRKAVETCRLVSELVPIVLPLHPRTLRRLEEHGMQFGGRVMAIDPLGYLDFMALVDGSRLVLTDSGGIQEETSVLGVPCLTLRENTERPVTVSLGTNRVVGTDPSSIRDAAVEALTRSRTPSQIPLWDGATAGRIKMFSSLGEEYPLEGAGEGRVSTCNAIRVLCS